MSEGLQQIHLLVDVFDQAGEARTPKLDPLRLPPGVGYLTAPSGAPPQISAAPPKSRTTIAILEVLSRAQQPQLLLVTNGKSPLRVNGQPVPRVALLGVKDQIQLPSDHILHVTVYHRLSVGAPPAELIGKECPLCRVPFTADTTVYRCPNCSSALHYEGAEKGDARLECVLLCSECPTCKTAVVLKEGYVYTPEASDV